MTRVMMLTALNATTNTVLDVTALDEQQRTALHGYRTARRHGHEPICRHCQGAVHLVLNHHRTTFWAHNPGAGEHCTYADVNRGESDEHLDAKRTIVTRLRTLTGWTVKPEHRFEADGELIVADVYAEHERPRRHQTPTIWEVQLSRLTAGELADRTEQRRRIANLPTAWVTPHDQALGKQLGIVTDPTGRLIVGRLVTDPYTLTPASPMPLRDFVGAVAGHHARLLWSSSGEDGEWIAFPPESLGNADALNRVAASRRRQEASDDVIDRQNCNRPVSFHINDWQHRWENQVSWHIDPKEHDPIVTYPIEALVELTAHEQEHRRSTTYCAVISCARAVIPGTSRCEMHRP